MRMNYSFNLIIEKMALSMKNKIKKIITLTILIADFSNLNILKLTISNWVVLYFEYKSKILYN